MAISRRDDAREMRALARRVHRRWLEYRRLHPGMSVPIDDTLSRILEHDPAYRPQRRRADRKERQPLRNPGVFTLKEIAKSLGTTVGDLLGEPGYASIRDLVPRSERRQIRDAVRLLRELFDLDDETLGDAPSGPSPHPSFGVEPSEFVAGDYSYPEPLRVWVAPPDAVASPEMLPARIQQVASPRFLLAQVTSDALAPELRKGWTIAIDTERTDPAAGELVAAYLKGERSMLGRWRLADAQPWLDWRGGTAPLTGEEEWLVLGTVTTIVSPAEQVDT